MSGQVVGSPEFTRWADAALAGSGYSAGTVGHADCSARDDLATRALADGFAAVAWGLARQGKAGEQ